MRSTPSPGVPGSNGIRRHGLDRCPRMDKREHGRRRRGSPADRGVRIIRMRYVGIDIESDSHVVAAVTADGAVAVKPTKITEDAAGYAKPPCASCWVPSSPSCATASPSFPGWLRQRPDVILLFDRKPTSRRPDLPFGRPARAAKVKDGQRPPPKAARRVLGRRERWHHGHRRARLTPKNRLLNVTVSHEASACPSGGCPDRVRA